MSAETHGHTKGRERTPEYRTWSAMLSRCENKNTQKYHIYGGRGIRVCRAWHSFESFLADMGPRPTAESTIERIDNNGNYEPGNCCWVAQAEQARNRRNNVMVRVGDQNVCLAVACKLLGVKYVTVQKRIHVHGWSMHEALHTPPHIGGPARERAR
jgi:hypothetical protein